MLIQTLTVALIVVACAAYAAWSLLPAGARRRIAASALRLPLPARLARRVGAAAQAASGCGCDGCDRSALKPSRQPEQASVHTVTFHPRARR